MIIGISGYIGSGKDLVAKIIQFHITNIVREKAETKQLNWATFDTKGIHHWDDSGWQNKKFAGKLKQMVSLLTGISVEDLEKPEVKNSELGKEWDFYHIHDGQKVWHKMTVRDLLQRLGTEAVRGKVHPNAWVNALFTDYKGICQQTKTDKCKELNGGTFCYNGQEEYQCRRLPNWIISDMRFPNEMEAVKAKGGITIRINRPDPVKTGPRLVSLQATDEAQKEHDRLGEIFANAKHPSETSLDNAEFDYVIDNDGTIPELIEKVKEVLTHAKIL